MQGYFSGLTYGSGLDDPLQFKGAIQVKTGFPLLADVDNGWLYRITALAQTVTITRSGATATATCAINHTFGDGIEVLMAGADQAEYNGVYTITVTGATTFTYTVTGTPATPATGTITATTRNVIDNAGVTYTNTGQTFQVGEEIAWNGTDWTELGSTDLWVDNGTEITPATAGRNIVTTGNIEANNAVFSGGTNTFNITNGTASIDVAASSTVNIDADLAVESASVINQDVTTDASPTFVTLNLAAAGVVYLGDSATDGSWRIVRDSDDLSFERRESGSWVPKSTMGAV